MSEMCFDDFDYDRHSDNCECEECHAEQVKSTQRIPQQTNGADPAEITPSCSKCFYINEGCSMFRVLSECCDFKTKSEVQQIKAEIATIATELDSFGPGNCDGVRLKQYYDFVIRLRKLSV